jgi:radical SAM protein (TIGR01212 family)
MSDQEPDRIFPWGHSRRFNDLSGSLKKHFGFRVQKLSVDAGFTCPNRDGTKGTGGCTFCNNKSFSPHYCSSGHSVEEQLLKGIRFFSAKYPDNRYLAYFQSYTNTYGDISHLRDLYEEALGVDGIVGLVIGTRPDCIFPELLEYLKDLSEKVFVSLEFGVESIHDHTLERINRGHTYADSVSAIQMSADLGISTGIHMILGLPGETSEMLVDQVYELNRLPISMVKFHQLQIIRGTRMEAEINEHPEDFYLFTPEEYIDLIIRILERLRPDIVVERFVSVAPPDLLSNKRWGMKNFELVAKIEKEMERRDTWQGRCFRPV